MRNLLLSLFFILPFLASGQTQPQPFKGSNTIVIQTQDSSHVALKKFAMALQDAGYTIDNIEKEMLSFSTKPKPQTPNTFTMSIAGYVRGDSSAKIFINGSYKITTVSDMATFKGPEFGADKVAFRELEKIAKTYPSATISYEKR